MTPALEIRLARAYEAALVSDVLTQAARRLADRGQALWSASEISESAIEHHVRTGMYHLASFGFRHHSALQLDSGDYDRFEIDLTQPRNSIAA